MQSKIFNKDQHRIDNIYYHGNCPDVVFDSMFTSALPSIN